MLKRYKIYIRKNHLLFFRRVTGADPETLKMKGASEGSSEKKNGARTLITIFFQFYLRKKKRGPASSSPPGSAE